MEILTQMKSNIEKKKVEIILAAVIVSLSRSKKVSLFLPPSHLTHMTGLYFLQI